MQLYLAPEILVKERISYYQNELQSEDMTMKKFWTLCLLFCLVVLSSCQPTNGSVATGEVMDMDSADDAPYPAGSAEEAPYAPPVAPTRVPYVFKTSEPGTVTVHGELLAMDPHNLPDPNDAIFLVPMPDGQVTTMPSFVVGEVPQADVDESTGEFMFTNIQPGHYAIMVLTLGNAQIPTRTEEGSFVIIRVEEEDRDQTIELGYIRIP